MLRGFYTATQGMIAQQRRMQILTNNMANANTPGFKQDQGAMESFPEMLLKHFDTETIPTKRPLNLPIANQIGTINPGVFMQEISPSFVQGDLSETGNVTDLALFDPPNAGGVSFFTVRNENGEIRYTRNGNFTIDGQGFLTTSDGLRVLDENNQPIYLGSDQFSVSKNGVVTDPDGEYIATLNLAFTTNPGALIKDGNGVFASDAPLQRSVAASVKQGFIERSNVDTAKTMTEMMSAYRAFEANQKILQAYDRSMEKAVTEIGKV